MSEGSVPRHVIRQYLEQERIRQRSGFDAMLCLTCGDWSELGSNYCWLCIPGGLVECEGCKGTRRWLRGPCAGCDGSGLRPRLTGNMGAA